MPDKSIKDKDWLDLAWKHFQQHAQQRIQYFNYFVIFSTILTTGLIATFQDNFQAPYLGKGIGCIQIFLSIIFWKIDERNKFLTQHSENLIKTIESDYKSYKLFTDEELKTQQLKEDNNKTFFINRQISHGKSYKIIFSTFFLIGIIGIVVSSINTKAKKISDLHKVDTLIEINLRLNSLNKALRNNDSIYNENISHYKVIDNKLDSLNISLKDAIILHKKK